MQPPTHEAQQKRGTWQRDVPPPPHLWAPPSGATGQHRPHLGKPQVRHPRGGTKPPHGGTNPHPGLCLVILRGGGGGFGWTSGLWLTPPPKSENFPPEKTEIYQRGPNLEVDFRYTNCFLASPPPPGVWVTVATQPWPGPGRNGPRTTPPPLPPAGPRTTAQTGARRGHVDRHPQRTRPAPHPETRPALRPGPSGLHHHKRGRRPRGKGSHAII